MAERTAVDSGRVGCSLSVGVVLAGIETLIGRQPRRPVTRVRERAIVFGLVGIALGWQAVLSVALIASITSLVGIGVAARYLEKRGSSFLLYAFLATAVQVYFWGRLERFEWWPNSQAGAVTMVVAAVGVALLTCLASLQEAVLREQSRANRDAGS